MVSIFKNTFAKTPTRNMDILAFFDSIKNGEWQDDVLNFRANKTDELKKKNICVTASGTFDERNAQKLIEHSGFICIDIDAKDQIGEVDIEKIKKDNYTFCVHHSIGGLGYALYVKIDPKRHLDSFLGLEKYFLENYGIVIDKSCKDVSRLRYVSYDPYLYLNDKAKVFKSYLKKNETKQKSKLLVVRYDLDEIINNASSLNLFDDYSDYLRCAFALSHEFGANGEDYFHALCQSSQKYDYEKAKKHYAIANARDNANKPVTINWLYWKFKDAGIKLTSEKTDIIKTVVRLSDNPKEELEKRGLKDFEEVIKEVEVTSDQTEIDLICELIKIEKVKFNEIKRNFEFNGKEATDRVMASFYQKVWAKIDDGISKDKIFTLIQNPKNTPSYNPIIRWFEDNKNLKTDNEFEKLKSCFTIKTELLDYEGKLRQSSDYLDIYLKKWLLGLISSAHGTYSLLILVLVGEQKLNKSNFFRNLLPNDLKEYYAESTLDKDKDSEILMCKKWLILDDEFGGKTKRDATLLKRLSSVQTFSIRAPYGRFSEDLNRLAVLCGTTNEDDIINDPTGNRRIIPINVLNFDIDKFKDIDKDKLFIELYNEWKNDKEGWFLTKTEIEYLNMCTEKNTQIFSESELINKYFDSDINSKLTTTDVMLKMQTHFPALKTNSKRIGQALKMCGYVQKIEKIDNKTTRFYEIICSKDEFYHNL